MPRTSLIVALIFAFLFFFLVLARLTFAQDAATGAIQGTVLDPAGARIAQASIVAVNAATGVRYSVTSDAEGRFALELLPPGDYSARAVAPGMSPQVTPQLHVDVGAAAELEFHLTVAGAQENVTVSGAPGLVDTQPSAVSTLLDERAIADLPLNGRRFSDLMLLSPGVTQDPRGLTSATNGDLSFGGLRGFQNSFLVDGGDFNNAFFAQARGLYRAPYQFSNEVVQEFRVSTNSYGAELGRAGGAVINVVTKSGSNHWHGTGLYYIRDSGFGAADAFMTFKPHSRQQQGGATIGGPIKKNKIFFFAGFDQHYFHVPDVVEFLDGTMVVQPQAGTGQYSPGDYEATDQALVFAAAAHLSSLAGSYPAAQIGNATYAKLDINLTPRNQLALRYNASRYWGSNNVFLDPASPVTYDSISDNGEETVSTDTGSAALTSGITTRLISHLRAQFSRDLRQSYTNTSDPLMKITDVIDGIGRSDQLPRATREHRAQLAETLSLDTSRHSFKFGGDSLITWIYDFFPSQQSGEYLFNEIKVDPLTPSIPMEDGRPLTPLGAYAHTVPHYYLQNFGPASTNPNSNDYAAFAQDTIRVTDHLAVNLGVRWDLQTFTKAGLISNPLFPPSGKVPYNPRNFGPRAGLAYSIGKSHPFVIRAGYGIFYVRIPQIYNSAIATENGVTDAQVFLNHSQQYPQYNGHPAFPIYPNPLVSCSLTASACNLPAGFTQGVTNDVSAFAPNFVTPRVQQASLTLEREVASKTTLAISYLYVHGEHLIRALDVNLPNPATLAPLGSSACNAPVKSEGLCTYPLFNSNGPVQNAFYTVDSFATWQFTRSLTCPFPPCINPLGRPIAQLGSIDEFQSAASSMYNGATVSINRRMARGTYLRLSYTYARAIDDGQDALVAGEPATVQNSYQPNAERGPSVTDQRSRFVGAISIEPRPFHRGQALLGHIFNEWKMSSIVTAGSGRPINATVSGDPNQDGNYDNDRLPGYSRNAFTGPDYTSTDLRLVRKIHVSPGYRLDFTADSFNLFNHLNPRVTITTDGLTAEATTFTNYSTTVNGVPYPAYYQQPTQDFLKPNAAFAPRQIQLGLKLVF